nr:MAG TPA: hypothetical protein [Caudoviricetes sp.]
MLPNIFDNSFLYSSFVISFSIVTTPLSPLILRRI